MSDTTRVKDANQALVSLVRLANHLTTAADSFFKDFRITTAQYHAIVVLRNAGRKISQQELGSQLVVTRANITAIIDRLEKLDYVRRTPHETDRRIKLIEITRSGLDLINRAEDKYFRRVGEIVRDLKRTELDHLTAIIAKLGTGIKRHES